MPSEKDTRTLLKDLEAIATGLKDTTLPLDERLARVQRAREIYAAFRERFAGESFEVVTLGSGAGGASPVAPFDGSSLDEGSR